MDFFPQPPEVQNRMRWLFAVVMVDFGIMIYMAVLHYTRFFHGGLSPSLMAFACIQAVHLLPTAMSLAASLHAVNAHGPLYATQLVAGVTVAVDTVIVILRLIVSTSDTALFRDMALLGGVGYLVTSVSMYVLVSALQISVQRWLWRDIYSLQDKIAAIKRSHSTFGTFDDIWKVSDLTTRARASLKIVWLAELGLAWVLLLVLATGLNAHTLTAQLTLLNLPHLVLWPILSTVAGPNAGPLPVAGVSNPRQIILQVARALFVVALVLDVVSAVARTWMLIYGLENIGYGSGIIAQPGSVVAFVMATFTTIVAYGLALVSAFANIYLKRLQKTLEDHVKQRYVTFIEPALDETHAKRL